MRSINKTKYVDPIFALRAYNRKKGDMYMKILFVRHGEDDDGYRGGWSRMDLTSAGRVQAVRLAEYIYDRKHIFDVSKIVSGDLPRTVSTAHIIAQKLKLPVVLEEKLREMNNGELAGMRNEEALVKYPGLFFNTLNMDEKYPGGESPVEFFARIKGWFSSFLSVNGKLDRNIVVVTHAGVINIIYHIINQIQWSNKSKSFPVANCSLHILDTDTMMFETENKIIFPD